MSQKLHTFAICAYKESEHLEECIKSLVTQREYSEIIMCTSTPNNMIKNLSDVYDIPLFVRDGKSDIQDDWNFACEKAVTPWVTVAHQDDKYDESYAKEMVLAIKDTPDAVIAFTDYLPIKNGEISTDLNSRMKRLFRTPMRIKWMRSSKFWKKYMMSCGNAVSCPSVAYNKSVIKGNIFTSPLKFALDWDTVVKYSYYDNPFIYIHKKLVYYRIHEEATSKAFTENNIRKSDEMYMFRQFWPDWIISIGFQFYKKSYETYD